MNAQQPRLTANGHRHVEAYCLMLYVCADCGHKERIWNSRDGVTPFGLSCPSCGGGIATGGSGLRHGSSRLDQYARHHKLHEGQRFWRDGTPDEAAAIMQRRIDASRGTQWECTPEKAAELIRLARSGESHDFQKGWPKLDTHSATQLVTRAEIHALLDSPEALEVLIDWHDFQESQADATGWDECTQHHEKRRQELKVLRDQAKARREAEQS